MVRLLLFSISTLCISANAEPNVDKILATLQGKISPEYKKLESEKKQLDAKYMRVCVDEEINAREKENNLGVLFWELERKRIEEEGTPYDSEGAVPKRCKLIRDAWQKQHHELESSAQPRLNAMRDEATESLQQLITKFRAEGSSSAQVAAWTKESLTQSPEFLKALSEGTNKEHGLLVSGDVLAPNYGIKIQGAARAAQLIDGVSDTSKNSSKTPLNKFMVITLPEVVRIERIRMDLMKLKAKRDKGRKYRFLIESSPDGKNWETLVDRTSKKGGWVGWHDLKFSPRPVKALRIKGTYNNRGTYLLVSELEAFCPKL